MSASQIQLYNGTISASGAGAWMQIATNTLGVLTVDLSGRTGTASFDCWLEGSNDGGTTYEEFFHYGSLKSSGSSAANTLDSSRRDVADNATDTAAKWAAVYPWLAFKHVRLAWTVTGTGTWTLKALLGGK